MNGGTIAVTTPHNQYGNGASQFLIYGELLTELGYRLISTPIKKFNLRNDKIPLRGFFRSFILYTL